MTFELRTIVGYQLIWDPMASKLSRHCCDYGVSRGVSAEGVKFNIVTVMVDHYEVVVPSNWTRSALIFDHGLIGIVWDFIGSCGRSLTYWAQSPHERHFSLISTCIPDQKRDSRALLMLLSAPWCALCILCNISSRNEEGTITW